MGSEVTNLQMRSRNSVRPVVLLVRYVNRWREWGRYETAGDAEFAWRTQIKGRGVTSWAWWGPADRAARALADPSYDPDEEPTP